MLIALAGLPSAGKSTTAKALAGQLGCPVFIEPEEELWPPAVSDRNRSGCFTALSWFRSMRVPQLFEAAEASRSGRAVIDSYYDVLLAAYLGTEPFAWLMPPDDAYFPLATRMAELDWKLLPKADVLVFLSLGEAVWKVFMSRRGREFDRDAKLSNHFAMQGLMEEACRKAESEHGTRLLIISQEDSTPDDTAARILQKL
jgi:hypothetical protein